jgi:hypothetical protein
MRYHWETIVSFMPREAVLAAMAASGFTNVDHWTELDLFHCYAGRKAPVTSVMPLQDAADLAPLAIQA